MTFSLKHILVVGMSCHLLVESMTKRFNILPHFYSPQLFIYKFFEFICPFIFNKAIVINAIFKRLRYFFWTFFWNSSIARIQCVLLKANLNFEAAEWMLPSFWVSQLFPDFVSAKAQNSRDFTSFKGTNSRSKSFNFFNHVTLIITPITVSYWRDQLFHLLNVTVQSANSIPDLPQIISKLSQAEYTRLLSHSFVLIPGNENKLFQ